MQLARAALLVLVLASRAHADSEFVSKVQVYADSDHTQVVSPTVQAKSDISPGTNVSVGYLVDAVSSASVDVVSQASPITIHDTRHQASFGLAQQFEALNLHGGYSFSKENDYLSHTLDAGLELELNDKNTEIGLGYGIAINTVGRANDMNFARDLQIQHLAASLTQTINTRLIGQVTYELNYADGYQASPYRFVPVRMSLDAAPELWVPETDPETRWRHAIVVGANQAVGAASSLQGDYRIYRDTWGITSHTFGARYFAHLAKHVDLRLRERFYVQNGASFYQQVYETTAKYMVYDRELSALWSQTLGAKLEVGFTEHLIGELKLDAFYYHYAEFAPLTSRTGVNAGLGLLVTY
ncbi:MAG TPA: DUF3570 domain-containing protein [Kofleriaceae bacterium]|nr:DUF3570 domain-containing protein [Kofleriaceae bacterium]